MSLIIPVCLSAFVCITAASVPADFQLFAYGQLRPFPLALLFLLALAGRA